MQQDGMTLDLIMATAEQVVATARQIEIELDYTGATLPRLEKYLLVIVQAYGGIEKIENDGKLMPLAISFAMYFGETVRRSIGGEWILEQEERMTPPSLRFDQAQDSANTANLNVIAAIYDYLHATDEHAIVYSYATYEKIFRGLPPYGEGQSKANGQ